MTAAPSSSRTDNRRDEAAVPERVVPVLRVRSPVRALLQRPDRRASAAAFRPKARIEHRHFYSIALEPTRPQRTRVEFHRHATVVAALESPL